MKPLLLRSSLTGRIYIVTKYKAGAKGVEVIGDHKYDVTVDFKHIQREIDADQQRGRKST